MSDITFSDNIFAVLAIVTWQDNRRCACIRLVIDFRQLNLWLQTLARYSRDSTTLSLIMIRVMTSVCARLVKSYLPFQQINLAFTSFFPPGMI